MGPHKNQELYQAVAVAGLDSIDEEFLRRSTLSVGLEELSELFEREKTEHIVTDPTLISSLYALARVQKTQMGIAGFMPLAVVDMSVPGGQVEAMVAPHHDEAEDEERGGIYRTRAVKLTLPDGCSDQDNIDIFGLNFYQPDHEIQAGSAVASLLVIGSAGEVQDRPQPVTGTIAIFAVRNNRTKDAKLYHVRQLPPDSEEAQDLKMANSGILYVSHTQAVVSVPDGTVMLVERLTDKLQAQATDEFESAVRALKRKENPLELSDAERSAVISTLGAVGSVE